jgi:hypothetical protein
VAFGEAEVVAMGATAFAASAVATCWWVVSTRVSRTIRTRNLRSAVSEKLQAAQLRLLEGVEDEEEQEGLRREVAKLKLLQAQMEEDAKEGRAIQGRAQVPELTPLVYLQKSLTSTLRDAKGSQGEGKVEGLGKYVSAVNLLIIFFLVLTIAFLP